MPFIGNQPALSYTSFAKQDFTTSATTSYTLDNPVANENEIALFINFVRQEPTTAYTASGTTLTLTSATSASDDMYAVFIGKAVQTVNPPAGSVDSSKINYPLTTFSSTGIDDNATSTAITIDSNENIGIGISNPSSYDGGGNKLVLGSTSGRSGLTIVSSNSTAGGIYFADGTTGTEPYRGFLDYDHSNDAMRFFTNGATERMRIDSSGVVLIGKTASGTITTSGFQVYQSGETNITRAGHILLLNRLVDDGGIVRFYQNSTEEGNIAVSGSTVSYNGFTGTHWSRFEDNSTPTILRGTVLETLDEMCDWYNLEFDVKTTTQDEDGNDVTNTVTEKVPHVLLDTQSNGDVITYNHEGTDYQATIVKEDDIKHMKSKISDTVDAKNVYGVFVVYDEDGEGYNDFYVASVGSFVVRIKANETIAKGNLLQSNGDGTAKVQTDDNVKSSSFAKILSTTVIETYDDGSFIVPCSLMC